MGVYEPDILACRSSSGCDIDRMVSGVVRCAGGEKSGVSECGSSASDHCVPSREARQRQHAYRSPDA